MKPPKVKIKVPPLSGVAAPDVMTRSQITDLANRVRQSEGQFGAQRVERAADEIPNLEKLYQEQALMRAFTGDNAQGLMTMKPSDFERYAATLGLSDRSLQNISHLTNVQTSGGFSDVPYLNINKKEQGTMGLPYIAGHEGRHRNRAMDAAGEQAGLVQLVPRSELREPFPRRSREDYLEALYKEMQLTDNRVMPEAYYLDVQRPAIDLPEFYAQGGIVNSAPEEAIKNTITDPQAFRMLDMDLANLALMSQQMQPQPPRRMAGGGAVHMDKGGKASKDDIMNLKPQPKAQDTSFASVRSLLADIGRNQEEYERIAQGGAFDRRKFTPENIYAMRLLQAANATPDPARYLESLNPYLDSQLQFELNPYSNVAGYVLKSEPNKVVIQRLEQVENTIPHELTHTLQLGKGANPDLENNTQAFARARGLPADMKSSVFPSTNVTDMTELWGNVNARAHLVNAAGGDFINSPEGRALFPTNTEQRDYYANALPGVNSITPDTGTFVPNNQTLLQRAKKSLGFADGGGVFNPQGADYDYQTARAYGMGQGDGNWGSVAPTSDDERTRHGLPEDSYVMLKGAQHPTWGKAVEAETARGSKIVKHGDRYYSVPSKAEGGEVSQSELDRMRFELAQAQNPTSPVMQATPRSPVQDFIGTMGGYMDQAGKFVSEAIAPTAEKHPVKHFLADLILASSLKGAGTALQDYTGTAREADEDNPVRGVIDKGWRKLSKGTEPLLDPRALDIAGFATPVVRGATKLARVGAKAIAPFATRVDDMVRELSASGAIPQPGLSIKSVGDQSGKAPKRLPKAAPATTASVPPVRTLEEQAVIDKFGQKHSQEAARLKKVEKALAAEAKQAENVANGAETAAPAPNQVKTKTPNFGAVPADFYRTMADTQGDDAVIKAAEAGKHLRKTPDGGFVGAPRTITSSQGLGGMRRGMDTDFVDSVDAVYLADPSRLGTWYDRAKQGIAMSTEPYQLNRVLGQHSVYSAGVSPESELAFALKHLNSRVAGTPTMAYRGAGMNKLDDADFMYRRPKLGFKIGEYGQKNDPRVPNNGLFGVNDFRRAQGMGYTDPQGKPWKAGVSTAMHPFMDAETALQVARANVAKVGGRGDWAGPHIQEVPWVYGKAQDFHKRGVKSRYAGDELEGIKQSLIDANNTARDYMYKHTLSATHEEVPGAALNHVPQVHAMTPAERAQYSSIGRWDRPTPEAGTMFDYNNIGYKEIPLQGPNMRGLHAYKATKGAPLPQGGATVPTDANRDALYSALGYRQLPSIPSQGLYTNQLGGLETNPMTIARPLMDFPTGGGGGRIADSSFQTAAATEQFRSLVGAQEAGAFNLGNTSKGVKGKNALVLDTRHLNPSALQDPTTGVQPSASQLTQIEQLLSKYKDKSGDPIIGVTATNRGISIFPFDPDTKTGDWNKIFNKNLKAQIEAIYPSKQIKAKMTTGYVPGVGTRHPKYGYPVASKPFSGAATIDMLEHFASLPPKVAQNLSESETVRNIIREKTKRDDKMGGARGDIQTTREFFGDANWNKVVELIRQGMAPTAALASVGYSASSMAGENK